MHDSTMKSMAAFRQKYLPADLAHLSVLECGSLNVNGSYRLLFEGAASYTGIDIVPGPGVDLVVEPFSYMPTLLPDHYDVVISGQALEHSTHPWKMIGQMATVLRKGGLCCFIAPWQWGEHCRPDCFRILRDGMHSMMEDAGIIVLETFHEDADCVGIGRRGDGPLLDWKAHQIDATDLGPAERSGYNPCVRIDHTQPKVRDVWLAMCVDRVSIVELACREFPRGTVVEVGTAEGRFAEDILKAWPTLGKLYCVDLWAYQAEGYNDGLNAPDEVREQHYRAVQDKLGPYPQVQLIREWSHLASGRFQDRSVDFCYVDANHSYAAVRQDLHCWFPKVRPGGIIAGHDYAEGKEDSYCVKRAVDEFARQHGLSVYVTPNEFARPNADGTADWEGPSWAIRVPQR